jgi:signal transduction histidine kinase
MLSEIVNGAQELLAAEACALAVPQAKGGLEIASSTSRGVDMSGGLAAHVQKVLESKSVETVDSYLLVPLTKRDDEAVGVLIIVSDPLKSYSREEVGLAETFASFGALALRKLRRQELEQALIDELQETLELRRDFINSVSHELRTPLACISGFSTTLLNYWGRLDEETMTSSVEKISHHAADLAKLVDALLDFGAMEHGRFRTEIEAVKLQRDIEMAIEDLQPLLADREVKVEVPDVTVLADRALLKRILINLLSNSVKASEADSTITVRATVGEVATVEVIDEGSGLTAEELERVFDAFWRSRGSVKAAKRGAGIGLTLVKEYVRTMGGQIGAESEPGRGATFHFTLPLAEV